MFFAVKGAKFDACGEFENLSTWADLINASGRPMMIENCHWGGDAPYVLDDQTGELWCPYNIYRAVSKNDEFIFKRGNLYQKRGILYLK